MAERATAGLRFGRRAATTAARKIREKAAAQAAMTRIFPMAERLVLTDDFRESFANEPGLARRRLPRIGTN